MSFIVSLGQQIAIDLQDSDNMVLINIDTIIYALFIQQQGRASFPKYMNREDMQGLGDTYTYISTSLTHSMVTTLVYL